MNKNPGFYFSKLLNRMYRPAMRNCSLEKHTRVGSESNCIGMKLGRFSCMGKACFIHNATIGRFCSIGHYCTIGGGKHEMTYVTTSSVFCRGGNNSLKKLGNLPQTEQPDTKIGNDVWIGEKCYIKAGVEIGDGAVIGAHSVVTRNVEPYSIVAGAPARELRKRFSEEVIEKLLALKWWDWDDEKLQRYADLFDDPQRLIEAAERGDL